MSNAIGDDLELERWVLRLERGHLTAPEWQALERWLAHDGTRRLQLAQATAAWFGLDQMAAESVPARLPRQRAIRRWRRIVVTTPVLAMLIALAWPLGRNAWLQATHDYYVAPGNPTQLVALDDGSRLHLQPGTAIDVELNGDQRRVQLSRGAALFDVVSTSSPFVVDAPPGRIDVTGTRFGVELQRNVTLVGVLEGTIVASPGGQPGRILGAGEAARITAGAVSDGDFDPQYAYAWADGVMLIRDATLAQALEQIEPFLDRPVYLAGTKAREVRLTAALDLSHPERLPQVLARHAGLEVVDLVVVTIIR